MKNLMSREIRLGVRFQRRSVWPSAIGSFARALPIIPKPNTETIILDRPRSPCRSRSRVWSRRSSVVCRPVGLRNGSARTG